MRFFLPLLLLTLTACEEHLPGAVQEHFPLNMVEHLPRSLTEHLPLSLRERDGVRVSCEPSKEPPEPPSTVHVLVPQGAESAGTRVPVLYLDRDRALYFPDGVGGAAPAVVPRPSELVALRQRRDLLIVAVDPAPAPGRVPLPTPGVPDGYTEYVTPGPP